MDKFIPAKVLYEEKILEYELGKTLYQRYKNMDIEMIPIEKHHDVEFIKKAPDEKFVEFKKYLVLGIRKSLQLTPNKLSADFIVSFTSSGCSAMCTYCYLVCNFFKGSYLRIFVNREAMINSVKRKIKQVGERKIYEIGSTSDMVLENTITGNLKWAIEEIGTSKLEDKLKNQLFLELIFMTYGYANDTINSAVLKGILDVFDRSKMCPKGRGKFCYNLDMREDAARYFRDLIAHYFPNATISYIV